MEILTPLMRIGTEVAKEVGSTVYHEIVTPQGQQLSPQQQEAARMCSLYTQEELLAAYEQLDKEFYEAPRKRMLKHLFENDQRIEYDAAALAEARQRIWELNHPPYIPGQSITMEPRDFAMQQQMGVRSAIGMTPPIESASPLPSPSNLGGEPMASLPTLPQPAA